MSQQELLTRVATILRDLGIEFMLTGSLASSLQGEPRATHDIDLVVKLAPVDKSRILAAFPVDQYYLSPSALDMAVQTGRMFNVLDLATGGKVDFWVLTDSPFDQSRFARRRQADLGDLVADVSAPEDTILMKLLWAMQIGGSEKQFQDVLRVYELQADLLDRDYLATWVARLGLESLWRRVETEAEPYTPPGDH